MFTREWHAKIAVFIALILLSSCTLGKVFYYNFSGIDDYTIFPNRELKASSAPFHFRKEPDTVQIPGTITLSKNRKIPFDELMEQNDTIAFLIIKDDRLIYEKYFGDHNASSISMSFSMAKSFLSLLIGCAIDDGSIQSVDQPVTDFVPELAENGFRQVSIRHLLQMTSGMDYTESDNPFGIHPRFYYTPNLEDELLKLKVKESPGRRFEYKSGENELLGLILARALKNKTITEYMQERIWEPLGMEYDGLWSIDRAPDGLEKTFCCISAAARDFAKIGRLYLHGGNWEGKQIISRSWVEDSTKIDTTEGSAWNYQYQWWLVSREEGDFMAAGHLGQYAYVNPENRVIIVRLGTSRGNISSKDWKEILPRLAKEVR